MKTAAMVAFVALATLGLPASQSGAEAKDDASVLRLRTCQDSWMDWENDPAKTQMFVDGLKVIFKRDDRDGSYLPIKPMSILGYDVLQLYPQCVGMGVGYPVIVSASFDAAKSSLEKQMGKPFDRCQAASEGKSCERELAKLKSVMLMEGSRGKDAMTLFGCYYFYEK